MHFDKKISIVFVWLSVLYLFLSAGCAKKEISTARIPIRYQIVQIPEYQIGDYEKMLDSGNDEVRYNAISNLVQYAGEYGKLLSKGPADSTVPAKAPKDENAIKTARYVYAKIASQLNNRNEAIKAVSLLFLSEFGSTYSDKTEIFNLVKNVETNNARTQFEQLNALIALLGADSKIEPIRITRFLNSSSWMVKSETCILLSLIKSDVFHPQLLNEYRAAADDFDKLLIIYAFRKGFGADVFNLLKHELQHNQNPRIKNACAHIIKNDRDDAAVIKWLISDPAALPEDLLNTIVESYYGELAKPKGQVFFSNLLLSNREKLLQAVNRAAFFNSLYDALKKQGSSVGLSEVEAAVKDNEYLRTPWIDYKKKHEAEALEQEQSTRRDELLEKTVLPKYNKMLERFLKESEQLFLENGMEPREVEETTRDLREFLRFLKNDQKQ